MIVLPIVTSALGVWQSYLSNVVGQRVMNDLRLALYRHLQWMPLRFFTETRTGEIQSRIANDVGGVQSVVTDTAASVLSNVATVLTTVIAMAILDWRLTLLSLGLLPVFAYITYRVGKVRRAVSTLTQRSMAEMSAITEESLSVSGILLSKTFGQQEASIERFRAESQRLGDLQVRGQMIGRWFFALIGTFFSIMPAFVILLAGTLIIGGDPNISIGTIVAFTTLQSRLFFPLGQLLNVQVEIQGALALFDRIFEYLEMPHEIVDAPDAVELTPSGLRGEVRFEGVSFRYPVAEGQLEVIDEMVEAESEGRAMPSRVMPFALSDISFTAAPGQLVALVGPSGSGKTTSTYLIPRLYDVDSGSVSIDGIDVRRITLASLGRVLGFVTQETYLFHDTVLANLRYAKPDATMDEIEVAARAAAIHDRIMELPDGYDTVVGERGYKLSGGEKQRVAIARVLLKDPRILILDEATSALDTVSERLIQAALARLEEGRTTIAIAHRLSTILRADQILVIQRGRIVERGTHDELIRQEGLYAKLSAEQFGIEQAPG
jgi:ATP-binding cassette subfamily B protein